MGFFQRMYYGKAGQADFNPEDLPKNRRELFFAMLRIRFSGLVGQNFIYLLFCIPAIAVGLMAFNFLSSLANMMVEDAALAAQFSRDWFSLTVILLALFIPCLGISGVGATGVMYILRNWARDQHAFGFSDIKDSIKVNWKQGLVHGLLCGVVNLACFVGWYFYRQQAAAATNMFIMGVMTVLEVLMVVIFCLWWMMNMLVYPMMITYNMKLGTILRNCLILVVARLPMSVGIWALSLLPLVICLTVFMLTGTMWALFALVVIYAVCGYSLTGFLYASYANATFDKFLNPRIDGATLNMGLRSDEYNDDFEDDDDDTPVNAQPGYNPTPAPGGAEAWPPRRPETSWLDAQAERGMPEDEPAKPEPEEQDKPAGDN